VTGELVARLGEADPADSAVSPGGLAELVGLVAEGTVSQSAAKEVLEVMATEGGRPREIVERRGLGRAGEEELAGIVDRALAEHADAVEKVRGGQAKAMGAIVGAVMRATQGRADGAEVRRMIEERIGV
jgi:aspartyl-tRNA(Asn)/glutamyl-tRNA(Gln) amidotransferase subunit B